MPANTFLAVDSQSVSQSVRFNHPLSKEKQCVTNAQAKIVTAKVVAERPGRRAFRRRERVENPSR